MIGLPELNPIELKRSGLIAALARRYGLVSDSIQRFILELDDPDMVNHLADAAKVLPTWNAFVEGVKTELSHHDERGCS